LRYAILKTLSYKHYAWTVPLFITLLFHTHYPIAAIFILTFGLHSFFLSYLTCEKKLKIFAQNFFKSTLPLFISLIFIIPSLVYFKTFTVVNSITTQSALGIGNYINNLSWSLAFFAKFEFLYLAIFLKILLFILLYFKKEILSTKNKILLKTSNFLSLFFCIFILVICRTVFVYERYVLALQPVLICIILLDISLCWYLFNQIFPPKPQSNKSSSKVFIAIIFIAIWINLIPLMEPIKGHLYELTHQYKGPLDFAIPYIKEKFTDPSKIIIATNYEENSYMYYLGSKTIVGYVANNIAEDRKLTPDVIVYRNYFNFSQAYMDVFNTFFNNNKYQKTILPIFDYPFNNIPELNYIVSHLYETKLTSNDSEKLSIYLKQ